MQEANCLGMDSNDFFQEHVKKVQAALRVCAGCTVQEECLKYGMAADYPIWELGVFGGMNGRQRKALRRLRNKAQEAG